MNVQEPVLPDIKKPHKSRTLKTVLGLILLLYVALIGIAYLVEFPGNPLTVYNSPFTVENQPVIAGQVAVYNVKYCRNYTGEIDVYRSLQGPVNINLGEQTSQVKSGCGQINTANAVIPNYVPSGTYVMTIESHYRMNAFREVVKYFQTKPFKIQAAAVDSNGNIIQQPVISPGGTTKQAPATNNTTTTTPISSATGQGDVTNSSGSSGTVPTETIPEPTGTVSTNSATSSSSSSAPTPITTNPVTDNPITKFLNPVTHFLHINL